MEFYADDLVPWLENQTSNLATGSASASVTIAMDALVPSSNTHLQTLRCGGWLGCRKTRGAVSLFRRPIVGLVLVVGSDKAKGRRAAVGRNREMGLRQLIVGGIRWENGCWQWCFLVVYRG
ncbi:unnamed protein product [Lactuca saligna]|uniref:Uncharacterized protein n=1 Tax=Lactuca saligna TaxID=75948 RepID=A0AA35Z9Q0_LACSI|nr:unnamed protein product [Lactuca saligna]